MANIINGDNGAVSGTAGLKSSSDGTGILALQTNGTTAVTVDASQNVGIGTASPSYKLDVRSSLAVLDGSANIGFWANGTSYTQIWQTFQSPNDLLLKTTAAKYIAFLPNSTEAMRVLSTGELVVGTTSIVGAEQLGIVFSDPSGKGGLGVQVVSTVSGASFAVFRNASGTAIGSITRNTTTNAVLYNTTSDYRLKENVTPLTNALGRVAALKPVQWVWKDCDGAVGEGFIAHEVQDVVPAAVSGKKDAVDADGNIKPQGMDSSYLVATLTAAIQEQQALITTLTARITALESK